ncbi:TauD/TfdA family dioxygenase [Pseudomonas mohnii]
MTTISTHDQPPPDDQTVDWLKAKETGNWKTSLADRGWALLPNDTLDEASILATLRSAGKSLGTPTFGRGKALEELIQPLPAAVAHPRSLSAHYGLTDLPLHTELSHRQRPCRYLLLACLNKGAGITATRLLDWRTLPISPEQSDLLRNAPILVRSGRRSFYTTLLSTSPEFLRYDPVCLEGVDARGESALQLIKGLLTRANLVVHEWRQGNVLVIDNWRVLHGRSPSMPDSGRRLARMLIDE